VIVEAIRQGRRALALTSCERELIAVRARLARARARGASGDAELLHGHSSDLPALVARRAAHLLVRGRSAVDNVTRHPCGSVDLILICARAGSRGGSRDPEQGWRHCASLLRPGGFLILTYPTRSTPADHSSVSVRVCQELGLQYWQHVIALLAPIRAGRLDPRLEPTFATDSGQAPQAVHADLLVFRKPTTLVAREDEEVEAA
jgi:SAM-dependent methyltransferase